MTLVDGDVLESHKPFTRRDVGGDLEAHFGVLPSAPCGVRAWTTTACWTTFPDLKPVTAAVVAGDGAGGLGHVHEGWAGMLNGLPVPDLGTDCIACLDCVGLRGGVGGALVASQVWAVDDFGGVRGHVGVGVLADVGVVCAYLLAVVGEDGEDVVGFGCRDGDEAREE